MFGNGAPAVVLQIQRRVLRCQGGEHELQEGTLLFRQTAGRGRGSQAREVGGGRQADGADESEPGAVAGPSSFAAQAACPPWRISTASHRSEGVRHEPVRRGRRR